MFGEQKLKKNSAEAAHPYLTGIGDEISFAGCYDIGPLTQFQESPARALVTDAKNEPMVAYRSVGSGHVLNMAFNASGGNCRRNELIQDPIFKLIVNAIGQ